MVLNLLHPFSARNVGLLHLVLARKILSVPASSASSERALSAAGQTITELCTSLKTNTVGHDRSNCNESGRKDYGPARAGLCYVKHGPCQAGPRHLGPCRALILMYVGVVLFCQMCWYVDVYMYVFSVWGLHWRFCSMLWMLHYYYCYYY